MFEHIQAAPRDAILGLAEAFRADPADEKINLTVGVFQDADGRTPVLQCVREAERRLAEASTSKAYLPISGTAEYASAVQRLLLGQETELPATGRVVTTHTPGGTGALRVAADFLHANLPDATVWLSEPTWPNHPNIFSAAEVPTNTYPYFQAETNSLDFAAMCQRLATLPAGDVVVLHGCCHNPTGVDPTVEQWVELAELLQARKLLPLVDFAYQGFAHGVDDDTSGLTALLDRLDEVLVASSFSKNFGLYQERVGALSVLAASPDQADIVHSQIKRSVRANYSNPPAHGGAIVTTVLGDVALERTWRDEVAGMRGRIHDVRHLLVQKLREHGVPGDFSFVTQQQGMFSFLPLTPKQVDELRHRHAIYMVRSGRINVAGITSQNVDRLCRATGEVLQG